MRRLLIDLFLSAICAIALVLSHELVHLIHAVVVGGSLPNGWAIHVGQGGLYVLLSLPTEADLLSNYLVAQGWLGGCSLLVFAVGCRYRLPAVAAVGAVFYCSVVVVLATGIGIDASRIHDAYGAGPAVVALAIGAAVGWRSIGRVARRQGPNSEVTQTWQ